MLRIEGEFPNIRYFSYQSYEIQTGQPIGSLIDYEIKPSQGVNPFNENRNIPNHHRHHRHDDSEGEQEDEGYERHKSKSYGRYQVHITDNGERGVTNELAATSPWTERGHNCPGRGCVALVILRLYAAEPGQDAFHGHSPGREWGYVPPPVVSVRYGAWVNQWTGQTVERYKELPLCDPEKNTPAKAFLDWKVPQLEGDWTSTSNIDNINDNFIVYTRDSSDRALFPNADANYLFATASNNRTFVDGHGKKQRKQLVARITGHLPIVAHSLIKEPPYIAEQDTYDARYVSLSTMALKGAGPVIDTVVDVVMEAKYDGDGNEWNEQGRPFSVVAAPGLKLLNKCPPSIYNSNQDLFLTTKEHDTDKPPSHLAFLYRQILSRWQTSGHQDQSIARAKHECLGQDDGTCRLRTFFIEVMGSQYPSISYFYCWKNETKGCSCEDAEGKLIGWGSTKDEKKEKEEGLHRYHHHPMLDSDDDYYSNMVGGNETMKGRDEGSLSHNNKTMAVTMHNDTSHQIPSSSIHNSSSSWPVLNMTTKTEALKMDSLNRHKVFSLAGHKKAEGGAV